MKAVKQKLVQIEEGLRLRKKEFVRYCKPMEQAARRGIFHDACQGGVGEYKSSLSPSLKLVGKQAERICIPFKVGKVLPVGRCQLRCV